MNNNQPRTETIQVRVSPELKERFFQVARERGFEPSEYLRQQIEIAINRSGEIDAKFDSINQTLLSLMQSMIQIAYRNSDDTMLDSLLKNNFLDYYREIAHDHAQYCAKGDSEAYFRIERNLIEKVEGNADLSGVYNG